MKTIYITWHYTNHGIAYLKHILSGFYNLQRIPEKDLSLINLDQSSLNETFDTSNPKGFLFDEIIYLTAPQDAFDKLSSRRFSYKNTIQEDTLIIEWGLYEVYKAIIDSDFCYELDKELIFVEQNYPDKLSAFRTSIWRNIQHYSINNQILWLNEFSNFRNAYKKPLKPIELNIKDLRDDKQIAEAVNHWAMRYFSKKEDCQFFINVSLGSTETQVVWHILSESKQLPKNIRFIKTYDDKSDNLSNRFKKFSIKESPTNLVSSLVTNFTLYTHTQSPNRKLVNKKLETFLQTGFSILLIGERGIGKSQIVSDVKDAMGKGTKVWEANCASFDDDSKAEAELFGYEEAAFTGAKKGGKKGLLEEADGGILFLDEIHHLSKFVQAKLMKAIQTDNNNFMSIRKMGSNSEIKVKCRLIFATNQTIEDLHKALIPDFYDRIVQHVIHIPPLRETPEDRSQDWESAWKRLRLAVLPPLEMQLMQWLNKLPLHGNYRDLQKIAMYYHAYLQFDEETREMISEKSAFQYAKSEFEKYHSPAILPNHGPYTFNTQQTTKEMIADYLYQLQEWAVHTFNGRKQAIAHFKSLNDSVTEKTFNDWKNRRSLK